MRPSTSVGDSVIDLTPLGGGWGGIARRRRRRACRRRRTTTSPPWRRAAPTRRRHLPMGAAGPLESARRSTAATSPHASGDICARAAGSARLEVGQPPHGAAAVSASIPPASRPAVGDERGGVDQRLRRHWRSCARMLRPIPMAGGTPTGPTGRFDSGLENIRPGRPCVGGGGVRESWVENRQRRRPPSSRPCDTS